MSDLSRLSLENTETRKVTEFKTIGRGTRDTPQSPSLHTTIATRDEVIVTPVLFAFLVEQTYFFVNFSYNGSGNLEMSRGKKLDKVRLKDS